MDTVWSCLLGQKLDFVNTVVQSVELWWWWSCLVWVKSRNMDNSADSMPAHVTNSTAFFFVHNSLTLACYVCRIGWWTTTASCSSEAVIMESLLWSSWIEVLSGASVAYARLQVLDSVLNAALLANTSTHCAVWIHKPYIPPAVAQWCHLCSINACSPKWWRRPHPFVFSLAVCCHSPRLFGTRLYFPLYFFSIFSGYVTYICMQCIQVPNFTTPVPPIPPSLKRIVDDLSSLGASLSLSCCRQHSDDIFYLQRRLIAGRGALPTFFTFILSSCSFFLFFF